MSPAPRTAALRLAGGIARVRRLVLRQIRDVESVAVYRGEDEIAVAMFGRHGWRRVEMALAVSPAGAPHMRRLVRLAHLTLARAGHTHLIVASIRPGNRAGARMALAAGFRPARLKQVGLWVFRSEPDGANSRRRQRQTRRGEGGAGEPGDPGGGQ